MLAGPAKSTVSPGQLPTPKLGYGRAKFHLGLASRPGRGEARPER